LCLLSIITQFVAMTIRLLTLLFCIPFIAVAQPLPTGNWSYKLLNSKVLQLTWQHPAMNRTEQISDAVLLQNKMQPRPFANKPANVGDFVLSSADGQAQVVLPNGDTVYFTGFDSGHVRGIRHNMPQGTAWYGGGERTLPMKRNGQRIKLYNNPHYGYELNADELNYSVPFVMGSTGYGLFFDNPSKGYIDFGASRPNTMEAGFAAGRLDAYIILGSSAEQMLANYATLTGKQPLPPRWAFGNFVSRFGYRSQAQAQDVVAKMKAARFPMDAVIVDIFWFGDSIKNTLGNLDFVNRTAWPNPDKMMADLKAQQIKTILVTEPFFLKGTKNFSASQPHLATDSAGKPFMLTDFYFGNGGLLDLFKPEAAQWFWQFYHQLGKRGVAGWWGDLGEPERHPEAMYHNLSSMGVKRLMPANEVHNLYGHMWSKMLYSNFTKANPGKRLFYLNRAGFAGSQRYSVFPWTGDVSRSWGGFRAQLPNLQSMSLSGLPYIHSDAGGFSMTDKNDPELYIRWLQMACFSPIFRPHGTALGNLESPTLDLPSEPVFKPEPYQSIARSIVQQRYQLLPYNYNLAWQQTTTGQPLLRPMFYQSFADTALQQATDQYQWGDAFVVAPVLEPGAATRKLYLPEGKWYNFYTNQPTEGGWRTDNVTLETMPVYVKAGSFVPHWDALDYGSTQNYKSNQPLTIRYYPGTSPADYAFYDDDGENPRAHTDSAAHQQLRFEAVATALGGIVLRISADNWPKNFTRKILIELPVGGGYDAVMGFERSIVRFEVNGKKQAMGFQYAKYEQAKWQQFECRFTGEPILMEFRW